MFVSDALPGFEKAFEGSGYELQLMEVDGLNVAEKNAFIERLALEKQAAAVIFVHMTPVAAQIALFRQAKMPVGFLAGRMEGADWCMVDEMQGAYIATQHLLNLGHRKIALVSGPLTALESRLREDGFLRALKEKGINPARERDIKILNFSKGEGYEAASLLMSLPEPPTAIFCSAGDMTALGLMTAIREKGGSVPGTVSVVGYDDLAFSPRLNPPLTTVRQPLALMASQCGARVLKALQEGPNHIPDGDMFDPELVVRKSTGAI